ncbi:MAG: acyl-CoA thioesterase [Solirubrobacterales bacterium]|nr:acyl-CoA thioesterase [Solirubrobacterales bacterium]
MSFVHHDKVRFGDLDAMRHLNNVAFLQFFESARIEYITTLLPDHDPAHPEGDFGLIFAECQIAYRSPAFYGEELLTTVGPTALRRSSFRLRFRMDSGKDGRLLAEGWGVMVGYDYVAGKATPLPEKLTAALRAEGATEDDTSEAVVAE